MSAIIALLAPDRNRIPDGVADRMLASMNHRGGDNVNKWSDGNIQLGHRMRWTSGESLRESMPHRSSSTGCVITCDARIDNQKELIAELGRPPGDAATDAGLILSAYEKWGEMCPAKLEGDFVFAIWDPNRRELFCARDQLGVKHFYYYFEPGKLFALASEVKALFCLPSVCRELNEQAVGDYLSFNFEDKESTLFKRIFRLPATCAMSVRVESVQPKTWCYWTPDGISELKLRSHANYHDAFREYFREAVNARLRSTFPIGSMLSGGLDSSAITCTAADQVASRGAEPIHSYSAIYAETSNVHSDLDEMQFMRSVIAKSGCRSHFIDCDAVDALKDMSELMRYADHPVGMANLHVHLECFKQARKDGVRVMLDGTDGDSTVSHGYEAFGQLAQRGRLFSLFDNARLLKVNMPQKAHSIENLAFRLGIDQIVPGPFQKFWHSVTFRRNSYGKRIHSEFDGLQWQAINKDFKRKQELEDRFRHFAAENAASRTDPIRSHWNDLTSGHYARVLETAELASQPYGIEMRFPFFDRRLIEFCIAMPPAEKVYNGWTRSVFRHAMGGILPEDVQWRATKANLGAGLKVNLIKNSTSKLQNIVNAPSSVLDPYVDMAFLKRIYGRFAANPFKSDYDCLVLVSVVHLHDWLNENGFSGDRHAAAL
jgi:asparagine synthase (glutamine-hydrolysing)